MAAFDTDRKIRFSGSWDWAHVGHFECHGVGFANTEIEVLIKYINPDDPGTKDDPKWVTQGQKIILD